MRPELVGGIRGRIVTWVGLVVVAAVAAIGYYTTRVAEGTFVRMESVAEVVEVPGGGLAALGEGLELAFRRGAWAGVRTAVRRQAADLGPGWRILVFDAAGNPVSGADPGQQVHLGADGEVTVIEATPDGSAENVLEVRAPSIGLSDATGSEIGSVHVFQVPDEVAVEPAARAERFAGALRQSVLIGVIVAGALALILTWFTATRILRPVAVLTRSAERMARGELAVRVPIESHDELGALGEAFNAMAESLEKLEESRRDMISDIAHELRTPLTNVRCQLEALQDGLTPLDRSAVDSLHEEVLLLARLVDDLRDLALASSQELDLDPVRVVLAPAVRRAGEAVPGADETPIRYTVPEDLAVIVDDARLQQILRNLIGNALRHAGSGGEVAVSAKADERFVRIEIQDNGEGLAPEHLDRVFERFFRTDRSRSRETGGAGLGLAIVKQLVEAHGGQVGAASRPGHGARFWFSLPSG
ncbi:MAG: ATP-binding protein [Xanthomonadales bacterium]|nr:ATP-binding protein [Xanthomonadales bacterium]